MTRKAKGSFNLNGQSHYVDGRLSQNVREWSDAAGYTQPVLPVVLHSQKFRRTATHNPVTVWFVENIVEGVQSDRTGSTRQVHR